MKQLGMTDKQEILEMGIDNFNDAARASVLKYTNEWEQYVTRQARWVDFENDYKTLNVEYMESVIWAFKRLYDKGLTYQGSVFCRTAGKTKPRYRTMSCAWMTTSIRIARIRPSR